MINRAFAAGFCAICCIGFLLAPSEASARSGGIAGRSLAMGAPRAPRVGALPLVRPGQIPPVVNAAAVGGFRALRAAPARRFHRVFRHRVPFVGVAAYGPYVVPDDAVAPPFPQTLANVRPVPSGEPVVVNGRICFAQSYIVPSEAGGTRPVIVTRC